VGNVVWAVVHSKAASQPLCSGLGSIDNILRRWQRCR
jgi:hypothetical protein